MQHRRAIFKNSYQKPLIERNIALNKWFLMSSTVRKILMHSLQIDEFESPSKFSLTAAY